MGMKGITKGNIARVLVIIAVLIGSYITSLHNYLLFHGIAEGFSIVIAFGIFFFAWNSRRIVDNSFFLMIGIAYLFVGSLDFVHTLAYPGMGVFKSGSTNLAAQLWIVARYVESLSILIALVVINRRFKVVPALIGFIAVFCLFLLSIFYWRSFPVCFVDGAGLTVFKIGSEYIISAILLASIFLMWQKRTQFDKNVSKLFIWAMVVTILSELSFTLYTDAYGIMNAVGHFLKIISFYLVYQAILTSGLEKPYTVLFKNLKDTQEALQHEVEVRKETELNLRNSMDNSPLGIRIITEDGKLLYANQAILDIYGYSSLEELVSTPTEQRYTPESYAEHQERRERRKLGQPVPDEYMIDIMRKDGAVRHVQVYRRPVIWNDETQSQALYKDVTERVQAQRALAQEKERLEVTLQSTGDGVIATDIEGKVTLLNRVGEQLTGWIEEEAIGKPIEEVFHVIHEHTRKRISNPVSSVLELRRIVGLTNHAVLISKDGTERIIADSGAPIHDERGNLLGVVMVFRDITEIRTLEDERLKAEKLESVGTLAGGIAHDFNNLLTGIMGFISLAKHKTDPGGEIFADLSQAEKASLRARDLTLQLLTFARGGAPIKKTANIKELLEDSTLFALRGSKVRAQFSLPDNLWPVEIDEGQINQVITNIVINADEAMPEGGIVQIGAKNNIVESKSALPLPKDNYVEITIKDNGVGISADILGRIFEPYFTTKQKGSGLGLATAYSIIKKHDGHISVESTPGTGTTFHIYLPSSPRPITEKKETTEEARGIGGGRILVMDDEEIIRELLYRELTDVGYEVTVTEDGTEAIERYREAREAGHPFDAVILDLTIPGEMGGKEAMEGLLEIDLHVKAIVSSGYANDPIMSGYKKYGFGGIAVKPYRVDELVKTLYNLLRKKK
ncbi:MAG: PAS domain S-box protein [Dehalococcoidia bacterium]|nr:PAS domain S-box protein [Dehalococcoidia bacterium]